MERKIQQTRLENVQFEYGKCRIVNFGERKKRFFGMNLGEVVKCWLEWSNFSFHLIFPNCVKAQLCEYYGYKSEEFTVTTTDGYILTVFRCYGTITKKQPVLLIHGMMDSSDTWVMNPGNRSLGMWILQKLNSNFKSLNILFGKFDLFQHTIISNVATMYI